MIQDGRYDSPLVNIVQHDQNMQFEIHPTNQTRENGQKPLFWLFGSDVENSCGELFQYLLMIYSTMTSANYASIMTLHSNIITICRKVPSPSIRIWNIRANQATKLNKMVKKLILGSF